MFFGKHLVGGARWRWLIGETFVVIIGVLCALGIEQAWSDRQDRLLELEYLETIRTLVQADIDFVTGFSRDRVKRKMDAIEAISPVVRGVAPVPDDVELFLRNVSLAAIGGVSPTYVVRRSTFEDLISTGNLRLIEDSQIRTKITSYYGSYGIEYRRTIARLTGYPSFVHGIIPSELRDDMNLATMESFNIDRAIEQVMSNEFETLLNREQNLGYFMEQSNAQFIRRAESFRQDLDVRIEQLK